MRNSGVPLSEAITVPMGQPWGLATPPMPDTTGAVAELRKLAALGLLAQTAAVAGPNRRRWLNSAAFTIATPIVFHRLTRVHEQRRGHRTCALGVHRLADACLDRFHDDLEAVVEDLLTYTTMSIHNLEGWITRRLQAVTIDAHRRRRGARGALQRPRLPGWLARGLDYDTWLGQLAIEILTWVGVPSTAGTSLWPLDSWAERRSQVTGDWTGSDVVTVEREVELVLSVMRTKMKWYSEHVERPLGAKMPPLAPALGGDGYVVPELPAVAQHEIDDAQLADMASVALTAIEARLAANGPLGSTVAFVIKAVFGERELAGELAEVPHAGSHAADRIAALIDDPAELDRIAGVVGEILADGALSGREVTGDV